ncbi:hypothetical protein A0J61_05175 [Choanephora cucurbitarum]|uniref:Uncharacterized protein n=1 Tax=Choanephora cucurbitarum TaxID=101091 RepID=A0A1C7NCE5_9FUNG|nr:hypothetical protein A0J61_05175 [Choanephora cucurbitarum]
MQNNNSPVVLALYQPENGISSLNHYYQLVLQPGSPWPETIFNNRQYCSEANFASWQSLYEPQLPNKTNKCTEYVGIDTRLGTTNSPQPPQQAQKIAMYAGIDTRHGKKQLTFKIPKRKELEKVTLTPCKYDFIIEHYTDINRQCDFCGSDFEDEALQLLMQLEYQKYLKEKERPFKYLKSRQKHLANAALTYCKLIEQDDENGLANLLYNSYEDFMSRIKGEGFVHTYRHLAIASKRSTYLALRKAKLKSDQNFNDTLRFSLVPAVGVLLIAEDLYGTKPKYDDNEISWAYMIMNIKLE